MTVSSSKLARGFLLSFVVLPAFGGCSPAPPPEQPTYEADVKPILLSRCVRCHGGGGTLNQDPEEMLGAAPMAPVGGYFDHYEDQGDCTVMDGGAVGADCKRGMLYYATDPAHSNLLTGYIRGSGNNRMPPPPSPTLTHRERQVLENWIAETPPLER